MNPGRIIALLICIALIVLGVAKLAAGDNTWGVIFAFIGLMNLIRWWKRGKEQ